MVESEKRAKERSGARTTCDGPRKEPTWPPSTSPVRTAYHAHFSRGQVNFITILSHAIVGVKLWGNPKFESQGRFLHQKVEDLAFSPCERYLITYRYLVHPNLDPEKAIIIWDICSGAELRNFPLKNPLDLKFQVQATVLIEEKQKKPSEKVIRGRIKAFEEDGDTGVFSIEEGTVIHKVSCNPPHCASLSHEDVVR